MSKEKEPRKVEMLWDHWCRRHLLPFKKEWPRGALLAQVALFQTIMSNPGFQIILEEEKGDIGKAMERCKPLCCFLGERVATAITTKALGGKIHCPECENRWPRVPCKLCQAMEERRKSKNDQ